MFLINWLIGIFIHKDNDDHEAIERYSGMTCIGYKCSECNYEWYEKRERS